MMMEQIKSKIKLPTREYVIQVKEFKFKIEPLSSQCASIIDTLQALGASVVSNSVDYPTSIFISYKSNYLKSIDVLSHSVIGAKLELCLNLLDNNNPHHETRLKNFLVCLYEVEKEKVPAGAADVEWVQVINKYKF